MGTINVINVQDEANGLVATVTEIQAHLEAASIKGGVVYLPSLPNSGTYDLGDVGLSLNGAVTLMGDGSSRSTASGGTRLRYTGNAAAIQVNDGTNKPTQNFVIRDLVIDCDTKGAYGLSLGAARGDTNVSAGGSIENVTVFQARKAGVRLVASQLDQLTNVRCIHGEADGFVTEPRPNSVNPNTSTVFINCHATNNKRRGLYFTQLTSSIWIGGTIENNGEEGIYLHREKRFMTPDPPDDLHDSETHPGDVGAELPPINPANDTLDASGAVEANPGTGTVISPDDILELASATKSIVFASIHIEGNNKDRTGQEHAYAQFKIDSQDTNKLWQEIELRNLFFSRAGLGNRHIDWSNARGTIWFPYFQNPSGIPVATENLSNETIEAIRSAEELSQEPNTSPTHLSLEVDLPTSPDLLGATQVNSSRPVKFDDNELTLCAVFAEDDVAATFEAGADAKVTVSRYANAEYSVFTNKSGTFVESLKVSALGIEALGDIEVSDHTKGLVLRSPNNVRFRLVVSDDNGTLDIQQIAD